MAKAISLQRGTLPRSYLFQYSPVSALLFDLIAGLARLAVEIRKRGRAPSNVPPILSHGQDPVSGVTAEQPEVQSLQTGTYDFARPDALEKNHKLASIPAAQHIP